MGWNMLVVRLIPTACEREGVREEGGREEGGREGGGREGGRERAKEVHEQSRV